MFNKYDDENYTASLLVIIGLLFIIPNKSAKAQGIANRPYPVYNTKTVLQKGPYLLNPTQTGITVCFFTAGKSTAKVLYWEKGTDGPKQVAKGQKYGLVPVGRMHLIRLKNLLPGTTYNYKVVSRRVIKIRPYWPEMGKWTKGQTYSFTTFSNNESYSVSFSVITDTHEHVDWIKNYMDIIDWDETDFLVDLGDIVNYARNRKQLFSNAIIPLTRPLDHSKPLVYARGNHENRGSFARSLPKYLPPLHEGRYYYAGNDGPLHFIVLDTGEDKPDTTNVYAGLNNFKEYRSIEYRWFKKQVRTSRSLKKAPFRIVFMHQPRWGAMTETAYKKWTALANKANVNLVLAGHWHRFGWFKPGQFHGNDYYVLVLGQHQVESITVTDRFINIEVRDKDGKVIFSAKIDAKGNLHDYYIAPNLKKQEKKMLQRM